MRTASSSAKPRPSEVEFLNLYHQGFARIAACTLPVALGDPATNAQRIIEQVHACHEDGAALALFPELSITGYALDDLLLQDALLSDAVEAISAIALATKQMRPLIVVGAPLRYGNRLYNCAVVLHRGQVLGVTPKTYLPNYREFYEKRHFASGADSGNGTIALIGAHPGTDPARSVEVPFGTDLIYTCQDLPDLAVHTEVCEDMWVPIPPSTRAALNGATVLLNLSASPITVARADDRHLHARSASSRCNAAYIYAAAMQGESSTDLSWDGLTMAYECGDLLGASQRFPTQAQRLLVDVDLDRIRQERMRQGTFDDTRVASERAQQPWRLVGFTLDPPTADLGLHRPVDRFPFVPDDQDRLAQDCYEAYNIQVTALEQRIASMTTTSHQPKVIIGVSGGLDSTHALIVAAQAMDRMGRPRTDIHAATMPGFATSEHTKNNAIALLEALGVTWQELSIRPAAEQFFRDLDHPYAAAQQQGGPIPTSVYDVTFENVQAGLRTDYLFRLAGMRGGFVLGTGDLSELALGWCTYGVGDQMSHYGVNAGVPKTLMQHLVRWVADSGQFDHDVAATLRSILATEISPELVPSEAGQAPQSTQATIGPYALHDFTLYYLLRRGYRPDKIAFLAYHAWHDAAAGNWPTSVPPQERVAYDLPTISHWLQVFVKRFFASQYKRTAMPNGPKVLPGGALSPRGDWRMPSDASAAAWQRALLRIPDRAQPTS